ncbi:unnamed protein product [Caenorhabditis brenneri]
MPSNCTKMTGDLDIDGKNVLVQKFSRIETWSGSIRIRYTDFPNLSFFKSLTTVATSFPDFVFWEIETNTVMDHATFWVESNKNLTSLELPKLTTVIADVLPIIRKAYGFYLEDNTALCLSESEFWRFRKMKRSFLAAMKICGPVTKQYCYSSAFLYNNMPLGCQILLTGIWFRDIRNASYQDHVNQALSTVEEVHGPIVIFRTDFTNLSFPLLHTIRSQYYDGQNDWQWQILIIRGNYFMTSVEFPKLVNWTHYGREPQLTNSANSIWKYTPQNCELFRQIPFFSITDMYSGCSRVPIFHTGGWTLWYVAQVAEKLGSAATIGLLCLYLSYRLFKTTISVCFAHFALVLLMLLTMTEALFVNIDYVQIFDDNDFAIPAGLRAMVYSKDAILFNQVSNTMYTNRLAFLISCSILRPLYLLGSTAENIAIVFCGLVFVVANFLNMYVTEALENVYTYVMFPLNWLTLLITILSGIISNCILQKYSGDYTEMISNFNRCSIGLILQAFFAFVFCGYSDGVNQFIYRYTTSYMRLVRFWEWLFYWWGGVAMRWHYAPILIVMILYLPHTFIKFQIRSSIVSNRSSTIPILGQ